MTDVRIVPNLTVRSVDWGSTFAALGSPVGGATGVLYARRSADGIATGDRTESGLAQFANLFNSLLQCWDLIVVGFARIPQPTKKQGILANSTTVNRSAPTIKRCIDKKNRCPLQTPGSRSQSNWQILPNYSVQPSRYSRCTYWLSSGRFVLTRFLASHSIRCPSPARTARLPTRIVSVSRPA